MPNNTQSALIEDKHNKTMDWLATVDKDKVIDLAVSERRAVQKRSKEMDEKVQ